MPNVYLCTKKMHKTNDTFRVWVLCCCLFVFSLFGYLDFLIVSFCCFIEQYRWHIQSCLANKLLLVHSFVMHRKKMKSTIYFLLQKFFKHLQKKFVMVTKVFSIFFLFRELFTLRVCIWIGFLPCLTQFCTFKITNFW